MVGCLMFFFLSLQSQMVLLLLYTVVHVHCLYWNHVVFSQARVESLKKICALFKYSCCSTSELEIKLLFITWQTTRERLERGKTSSLCRLRDFRQEVTAAPQRSRRPSLTFSRTFKHSCFLDVCVLVPVYVICVYSCWQEMLFFPHFMFFRLSGDLLFWQVWVYVLQKAVPLVNIMLCALKKQASSI